MPGNWAGFYLGRGEISPTKRLTNGEGSQFFRVPFISRLFLVVYKTGLDWFEPAISFPPPPPTYATEWCNHVTTLYAICHWVCACVIPSTPTSSYSVSQQLPTDQTLLGYNDWRKWLMGYDDSRLNIVKSDYPGSPLGFMIQVSVNPGSPSGIGRDYPWRS